MKLKTFFIAIFATFFSIGSVTSYALDVYLKNSSVHNVLYFKFPSGLTYGPVEAGEEVKLSTDDSTALANSVGEVFYASNTGLRSCGIVDFARANVVAFRVGMLKHCHYVIA